VAGFFKGVKTLSFCHWLFLDIAPNNRKNIVCRFEIGDNDFSGRDKKICYSSL
jgi:phosphatidylethanolamine-binding protein (PEBP) family uncharacterized protein